MTFTRLTDPHLPKGAVEIMRAEVGSRGFGTSTGDSDRDHFGVFVESPAVLGLDPPLDHYRFSTAPEDSWSGPDDTDLTWFSVRKWANLAAAGNPMALVPLFIPSDRLVESSIDWLNVDPAWFASRRAAEPFIGYLDRQRALGAPGFRGPNWKALSHMMRLAYQGVEYLETGRLTLPLPPEMAGFLQQIRAGMVTKRALDLIVQELRDQIVGLAVTSALPSGPDREAISAWMQRTYLRAWQGATISG